MTAVLGMGLRYGTEKRAFGEVGFHFLILRSDVNLILISHHECTGDVD